MQDFPKVLAHYPKSLTADLIFLAFFSAKTQKLIVSLTALAPKSLVVIDFTRFRNHASTQRVNFRFLSALSRIGSLLISQRLKKSLSYRKQPTK